MTDRTSGASRFLRVAFRAAFVAAALGGLATLEPPQAQAQADKITICHIPPGNPENAHTITIAVSALETHLTQHGDNIGNCGSEG
jgi:hypothetical protein